VFVQAALNGDRTCAEHPTLPVSAEDLARDAAGCAAAGARAIHMHPRDAQGRESLLAEVIDAAARAVRDASGVPVGVSTGEWIEPDLQSRLELVAVWSEPDYASVNLGEDGSERVMEALLGAGIGIEAGISHVEEVERLGASGLAGRVTRVLVEPFGDTAEQALRDVRAIHAELDRLGIEGPRLQHSDGPATWPVLRDALERGRQTRVGLEDVLVLPDGSRAAGNEELIRAALV
jgi:uncharacterized protein (DUF849 family)